MIDLHTHTNCSDGSDSPEELIDKAVAKGLTALAITDHDTVDGLDRAINHAKDKGIRLIPGIELGTEYHGKDIHIVGLNIDKEAEEFADYLKRFVESRDIRNEKMCALLTEAGMPVTYDELKETFPGSVITRAHMARYLFMKGYTTYLKEAFERYIGDQGPCYLPREKITAMEGVALIRKAKGIPVLAHPLLYKMSWDRIEELVDELIPEGLLAMEAVYSTNTSGDEARSRQFAADKGILISGGSDYHGVVKPDIDLGTGRGKLYVDEEILEKLLEKQKEVYGS
ncbi:MAG: PHP domain-containing protein [Lachnospiraceae bacterium]|nr:PHP domain-containing protein [Lachnospiraceae bacterium]